MATTSIKKHIVLPRELAALAETKASRFGFKIGEYIRHLIVSDVEEDIPMVDVETEKRIGKALKNFEKGDYVTIRNKKELDKLLDIKE
ncbi:MAG TPA: hypothetical protein ENI23_05830 [bacterium]|nr:hypothetical protein [bacterium]